MTMTTIESQIPLRRLQQVAHHLNANVTEESSDLSIVHGPLEPALASLTLGGLLDEQAEARPDQECLIVPWTGARISYSALRAQSLNLARGMLAMSLRPGDRVGILASNCEEYAAVLFATSYIGAILVLLNSTYTAVEAQFALGHSGCKIVFLEENYGPHSNTQLICALSSMNVKIKLREIVALRGEISGFPSYSSIVDRGQVDISERDLEDVRSMVHPHDVCNIQYTSGSTGDPKAACLTHFNLYNNAHSIASRMSFSSTDILCCPPPLFHCFGLVLGLLACMTHGATIVLPSATFSASAVLHALSSERCTALHGVPAMFEELLALQRPPHWSSQLRTGIVAGAPVSQTLMERMFRELGMREFTSSYGLTEASPTCFNAHTFDTIERRMTTVGRLLPHLHAKIIDEKGNIVPFGTRGQLCIAGYSLQQGYWNNSRKTGEAMRRDARGILWLHTGDEAIFDRHGYCTITGRLKDIIIRGGENIYPLEIESRLVGHPSGRIHRAAVIGIKHVKYGEVAGAFLMPPPTLNDAPTPTLRPTDAELRAWVREILGWHKAPAHLFWLGDAHVGLRTMPQTGSGKVKKHVLRDVAEKLVNDGQVENFTEGLGLAS